MSQLLEEILARENMLLAYKKVKANGGASGIDGVTTGEVRDYLIKNWTSISAKESIRTQSVEYILRALRLCAAHFKSCKTYVFGFFNSCKTSADN